MAQFIPQVTTLPANPATTNSTHLVISSTSNWGGYRLVAAISRLVDRDLLPSLEDETVLIRQMVDLGAVDGVIGASQYSVDAMSIEEHSQVLSRLHNLLSEEGILP